MQRKRTIVFVLNLYLIQHWIGFVFIYNFICTVAKWKSFSYLSSCGAVRCCLLSLKLEMLKNSFVMLKNLLIQSVTYITIELPHHAHIPTECDFKLKPIYIHWLCEMYRLTAYHTQQHRRFQSDNDFYCHCNIRCYITSCSSRLK